MQNNCTKRRLRLEFLQFAFFKFKMRRKHKKFSEQQSKYFSHFYIVWKRHKGLTCFKQFFLSLFEFFLFSSIYWFLSKIQEWDFFTDLHTQCLFGKLQEKKQIIQFHTSFSWIFAYENGIFGSRRFSLEMLQCYIASEQQCYSFVSCDRKHPWHDHSISI